MANDMESMVSWKINEKAFNIWMRFVTSRLGLNWDENEHLAFGDKGPEESTVFVSLENGALWASGKSSEYLDGILKKHLFLMGACGMGALTIFHGNFVIEKPSDFKCLDYMERYSWPKWMGEDDAINVKAHMLANFEGMGFKPEILGLHGGSEPETSARGFGAFLNELRQSLTGREAGQLLIPFSALGGERAPTWLMEKAGERWIVRALATAIGFGNVEAAQTLMGYVKKEAPLAEADGLIKKMSSKLMPTARESLDVSVKTLMEYLSLSSCGEKGATRTGLKKKI